MEVDLTQDPDDDRGPEVLLISDDDDDDDTTANGTVSVWLCQGLQSMALHLVWRMIGSLGLLQFASPGRDIAMHGDHPVRSRVSRCPFLIVANRQCGQLTVCAIDSVWPIDSVAN